VKKLISMALAGVLMFGGTTVLANNPNVQLITSNAIFTEWEQPISWGTRDTQVITRNLRLSDDFLRVQLADEVIYFMSHNDFLKIFSANSGFGMDELDMHWNSETDALEITSPNVWGGGERTPVDPIDMDNINNDEWIHLQFIISTVDLHGASISDSFISIDLGRPSFVEETVSGRDITTQTGDEEDISFSFESVFGCNAEDIRTILGDNENEFSIFNVVKVNIQDLRDSELSDNLIDKALELQRVHGTVEILNIAMQLENMKSMIQNEDILNSENFRGLIEIARQTLESKERGGIN